MASCRMEPVSPIDTVGLRCATHQCEPADPCLQRDCPHCGSRRPTARTQGLLLKRAQTAQALVERLEKRSLRVMRALVEAREKVAYYRRKLSKLDATLDINGGA